jgi:hypothetical protein
MTEQKVPTLSDGTPSTLGGYRAIAAALGGDPNKATEFLDKKAAESPNGLNEVVVAAESQMLLLIVSLITKG